MPSLKGMNVQALMSLRNQVDKRLLELREELQKQLAALDGHPKGKAKSPTHDGTGNYDTRDSVVETEPFPRT
jgi:hypothetical protein